MQHSNMAWVQYESLNDDEEMMPKERFCRTKITFIKDKLANHFFVSDTKELSRAKTSFTLLDWHYLNLPCGIF